VFEDLAHNYILVTCMFIDLHGKFSVLSKHVTLIILFLVNCTLRRNFNTYHCKLQEIYRNTNLVSFYILYGPLGSAEECSFGYLKIPPSFVLSTEATGFCNTLNISTKLCGGNF